MAATYDLSRDFASGDELKTQVPYWVVGVARYANPVTWDPDTRKSVSENDDFATEERDPLVLTSEVMQVRTSAAKEAHVTNLSAVLFPHRNFLADILPGDWVVCCLLNSETQGREVARKMRAGEPINGWGDGLKFVGKATSIRKSINVARESGSIQTGFNLQGVGFGEFDALLFYHPQLQRAGVLPQQTVEFGTLIKDIVNGSDGSVNGGTVDINLVLPKLIEVIFGQGVWVNAKGLKGTKTTPAVPASPNSRYLVPKTVARWLGLSDAKTYNKLLRVTVGLQHYRTVQSATADSTPEAPWRLFQPDGPQDLIGWFPLTPPPTQASVWDMLSSYSNPPLNEMYVTLRADADGNVLPNFIVRQTPYSTDGVKGALAQHKAEADAESKRLAKSEVRRHRERGTKPVKTKRDPSVADATEFLEVPRWKLPASILFTADIGRSDALRFNMVHVSGTGYGALTDETGNFVRAPPITDSLDVKRNGVRPYLTGVNCMLRDLAKGPKVWRDIMADIVMGQHLTLTGQFTSLGIQVPIAPGDNLEFEGLVFHIEAVAHVAGISADGNRSFQTILQVSHGVEGDERQAKQEEQGQSHRAAYFAGTDENEQDLGRRTAVTTEEG